MAHMTSTHRDQLSADMQECIQNCTDCHNICVETIRHCLSMGGDFSSAEHIGLLMDCAEICDVSADFMLRGSHRHQLTCRVCYEVCRDCASECERMANGDKLMMECAQQCRKCSESCAKMSGVA